jgi:hypothetical protein
MTAMPKYTAMPDAGAAEIDVVAVNPRLAEDRGAAVRDVSLDAVVEVGDSSKTAPAPLANVEDAAPDARAANKEVIGPSESAATAEPTVLASNDAANEAAHSNPGADRVLPNGDEHDVRMAEIAEIFDHAATPLLERCALVAEWVHHAEAKLQPGGQLEQKPQGGRPEGGILRAARELHLPGKTVEARRQFIRRAITINTLWPETKAAARAAKLDKNQSALLFIAKGNSPQEQLDKIREFQAEKAAGRHGRKTPSADNVAQLTPAISNSFPMTGLIDEVLNEAEQADVADLEHTWDAHRVLPRIEWERATPKVRRQFAVVLMAAPPLADDNQNTPAPPMSDNSCATKGPKDEQAINAAADQK